MSEQEIEGGPPAFLGCRACGRFTFGCSSRRPLAAGTVARTGAGADRFHASRSSNSSKEVVDAGPPQQVVLGVDDGSAHQVVGGEVAGDRVQRVLRAQWRSGRRRGCRPPVRTGGSRSAPEVHASQVFSRRCSRRWRTTNTRLAAAGLISGCGSGPAPSATVVEAVTITGLLVIRAARGVGERQQLAHRFGFLRIHADQGRPRPGCGQPAEQVGGVVGVHRLQDVDGAVDADVVEDGGLVVGRQLCRTSARRPSSSAAAIRSRRRAGDRAGRWRRRRGACPNWDSSCARLCPGSCSACWVRPPRDPIRRREYPRDASLFGWFAPRRRKSPNRGCVRSIPRSITVGS